ncbi:AP2 domain-containing protein [Aerococcaceae bacterium NML160702]|nr:AP2 domain-containing protein [Aerococcaceae bacterium NML160702]
MGYYTDSDRQLLGNTFGRLTVIKRVNNVGRAEYLCKCTCGNETIAKASYILNGRCKSCGCLKKENSKKLMKNIQQKGLKKVLDASIDGTNINSLNQKISKNNTSGIKGVYLLPNGRYRASISFRRKNIHLGVFDTIDEAKRARIEAEEKYFKPYLDIKKDH